MRMNKNDFRVQFPLWNIALWAILIIYSYGGVYSFDLLFSDFDGMLGYENDNVVINWNIPVLISIILGTILLIIFFVAYFTKLKRHNKEHPNQKMKPFSFIKFGEFIEEDELFKQVTQKATKKVYILYANMLPIIVIIMFFPIHRYIFMVTIFLTLIIQNVLYYREIRKYIED